MGVMDSMVTTLEQFADEHGVTLNVRGECGFGRPCVGFGRDGQWIDYNPRSAALGWDVVPGFEDMRVRPSVRGVPDAYHKHECMAVLVQEGECCEIDGANEPCSTHYDAAVTQLWTWVNDLLTIAEGVEVVQYDTGHVGLQALLSGERAWAIRPKRAAAGATILGVDVALAGSDRTVYGVHR